MPLYEQLGGESSMAVAVDAFYDRMLADPEVEEWFRGIDLTRLKQHQRAFLAVGLGGPEQYTGRSMRTAHTGLAITDEVYSVAVTHLGDALRGLNVDAGIVLEITRRIEMMRAAIVEVR